MFPGDPAEPRELVGRTGRTHISGPMACLYLECFDGPVWLTSWSVDYSASPVVLSSDLLAVSTWRMPELTTAPRVEPSVPVAFRLYPGGRADWYFEGTFHPGGTLTGLSRVVGDHPLPWEGRVQFRVRHLFVEEMMA